VPHFTLTMSPAGPMVDAVVLIAESRRLALVAANLPQPKPVKIRALIDTGASHTCIDPSVMKSLALTPRGSTLCNTPTTGSQPVEKDEYDVAFLIPAPDGQPLVHTTLAVMEAEFLQHQKFHALIGRDILKGCILTYNGSAGLFMLAY